MTDKADSNAPLLKFENPVFSPGVNITIRRGVKWACLKDNYVALADLDGNILYWTTIRTKVMRFCDLSKSDIQYEHDPSCRTLGGLSREMQKLYAGFRPTEIVTVVEFVGPDAEDLLSA